MLDVLATRIVITCILKALEIFLCHITGDVIAVKYRGIKMFNLRCFFSYSFNQVIQVLVKLTIGSNRFGNLLFITVMSNQFIGSRHINSVHIGKLYRWCGGRKIHFLGTGITSHLNNLL